MNLKHALSDAALLESPPAARQLAARWVSPGTTSSSRAGRPTTSPTSKATVEAGGGTYIDADADRSTEKQLTDIDTLIAKGAKVLIVLAQDTDAILPAVAKAKQAGIPIIAYDRLIEDPASSTSPSTTWPWARPRRPPCWPRCPRATT